MPSILHTDFLKTHGSENDFVLIDLTKNSVSFTDDMRCNLAIAVCDRNSIIGADGVLYIEQSQKGNAQMRIFNSDGSEAEMCGNGLRIVGRYVSEKENSDKVTVENVTGIVYPIEKKKDFFENVSAVTIQFPKADFNAALVLRNESGNFFNRNIPALDASYIFSVVSMPNPHIVSIVEHLDVDTLTEIGTKSNNDKETFVNGANVSFVQIKSREEIFVGTFERGVGLTNACGTAMFASVVVATQNGLLAQGEWIKVRNAGGFILIKLNEDYSGYMTGNATYVYSAHLTFDFAQPNDFAVDNYEDFILEVKAYEGLKTS